MKMSDQFPSKYLKKENVGNGMNLTIKQVQREDVGGNGDPNDLKPVIYFHELQQGMTCNKTNAGILIQLFGDETDQWIGKQICLYNNPHVYYAGKQGGISVRPVDSMQPGSPSPSAGSQPAPNSSTAAPVAPPQDAAPQFNNPSAVAATAQAGAVNAPGQGGDFNDDIPW